ncbi:MAG TPA: HD-GYP domain-containing protein [Firmicutes bacterium]|nr:HD-GYP domain-containing protein [Bacillota bacterium]
MEPQTLPLRAKIYVAFLSLAALTFVFYLYSIMDWSSFHWAPFLIFLFLTFISDSFPVNMPRGGVVSVGFASLFASILLFEPLIVVAIAVLSDLFSWRKGRTLPKYIFNASQLTLAVGSSSLAYRLLNPAGQAVTLHFFGACLIALITCFFLNITFVTLILSFIHNENPYSLWLTNAKWTTPNFLSMAPLGMLITLIYIHIGFWGLVLFLVPLALARHSFQSYIDMRQAFLDTIQSLSTAIDAKDPYTRGHSQRVAKYAVALARELKWPEDKIELFHYVAVIHDVGKIAIPENILQKQGKLTAEEFKVMEKHTTTGSNIIKDIKLFEEGGLIVNHHHERWDGTGYPSGLNGEQIPEGARILAIADAFDAMISDRPYRRAMNPLSALQEIKNNAGTQFDPRMVKTFCAIFPKLGFDSQLPVGDTLYGEEAAPAAVCENPPLEERL